jgi:hypothetical protein
MKTPVATEFYEASPFFVRPLETQPTADKGNGNRNSPPAPNPQLRPISALMDWVPASYKNSRLPSSLKEWLASREALMIGGELTAEPVLVFEI